MRGVEHSQNRHLGLAIAALRAERLSGLQMTKITRAWELLPHCRAVLSDFEAELIEEAHERLQRSGWAAPVTEHEWHVIDTSLDAMNALLEASRGKR